MNITFAFVRLHHSLLRHFVQSDYPPNGNLSVTGYPTFKLRHIDPIELY